METIIRELIQLANNEEQTGVPVLDAQIADYNESSRMALEIELIAFEEHLKKAA